MVPNGHPFSELRVQKSSGTIYAVDNAMLVPAVGAAGRAAKRLPALGPFDAGLK
jgi:hypothetical protein